MIDIVLSDLIKFDSLSRESTDLCTSKGLFTLRSILNYLKGKDPKMKDDNHPRITTELAAYVENKLISHLHQSPEHNISLDKLMDIEDMTSRAINVCLSLDLHSLRSILNYRYENAHLFLYARNLGIKTNNEIIKICNKYDSIMDVDRPEETDPLVIEKYRIKKLVEFDGFEYIRKFNLLDNRCLNFCNHVYLGSIKRIFQYYSDLRGMGFLLKRNCDDNINNQLLLFCSKYGHLLPDVIARKCKPEVEKIAAVILDHYVKRSKAGEKGVTVVS